MNASVLHSDDGTMWRFLVSGMRSSDSRRTWDDYLRSTQYLLLPYMYRVVDLLACRSSCREKKRASRSQHREIWSSQLLNLL